MTNKEALQEVIQVSVSDATIEKAFLDASDYGLTSSETYTADDAEGIDWIAINVLENFLDADIKEGGYEISYKKSIENKISRLRLKWKFGIEDDFNVQDASSLW